MVATSFIMAASSLIALSYGAPVPRNNAGARSLVERASYSGYTVFGGDGSTGAGWPSQNDWQSFDSLFDLNKDLISSSCTQFGVDNNSEAETAAIKKAIQEVAASSQVPEAYLLAIMMQESKGCVRAPTTNYGVRNPGLMQDHDGKATCNEGGVQNPCPDSTIKQMIAEGAGEGTDFGLSHTIAMATGSGAQKFYQAARIYNSGSIDSSGNLGGGIATHCYASDIANRLLGWTDQTSSCSEGSIGSLTASAGSTGNANGNANTPTPTENENANDTPTETPETPATPTTQAPSTGNNPSAPHAEGAAQNCKNWYVVNSGDTCDSAAKANGITFAKLKELNTGLDSTCSNLWLGSAYCVEA